MATTNFYLDKKTSTEPTYIMFSLSDQGKRIRITSGEKILPKHWNGKKQQVKSTYAGCLQLNNYLKKFAEDVLNIYREAKTEEIDPKPKYIKQKLAELKTGVTEKEIDFIDLLNRFIEENRSTKAPNTIQTYKTLRYHLKGFQEKTRYKLSFESINISFRDKFHHFLVEAQNLNHTSVQKNFAVLKRLMRYATEHGYNQSIAFHQFSFKAAPSTKIALTERELEQIELVDLSNRPGLERVRDMFLFGCETSLRHSDLANVRPANIKTAIVEGEEVVYLDLIAHKTRGEIQAPLSSKALALIEQYKDDSRLTCFPVISNQKFNKYIKEVGKLAGLDSPVEVVKFVGNKRIQNLVPKYELISTHTQRRTFVTLHFERGGSVPSCMVYTGHKNYKELETYRKKTLQHKLKVAKGPFQTRILRKVI